MATTEPRLVTVRYAVARAHDDWAIGADDELMPETNAHHDRAGQVEALLTGWAERSGRAIQVGGNLAVRWDRERPSVGVDPDVYAVEPPPPEGRQVRSLRMWLPGHTPPLLAVEIVSGGRKDYTIGPEKYAASGTSELWVFDPELAGPHTRGGPFRLQLWCRTGDAELSREYAGPGPFRSRVLDAWVFAVDEGQRLRIADDEQGTSWWRTPLEAARERADAAQTRIAELEAELGRRPPR